MTTIQGQSGVGLLPRHFPGNVDANGVRIEPDSVVSYHGKRYRVFRVGYGAFTAHSMDINRRLDLSRLEVLSCFSVQVVT